MRTAPPPEVYQLHVWLREISPMIWRRLLVRSDCTIADLHYTLQIAMGWEGYHLHQFIIRGKRYGIPQPGGTWFPDDPTQVRLANFRFRLRERFLYEYHFGDLWQHAIRVEKKSCRRNRSATTPPALAASVRHRQKIVGAPGPS